MYKRILVLLALLVIILGISSCGKKESEDIEPEKVVCADDSHDFVITNTGEPTCTNEGFRIYRCLKCETEKKESIEALGHNYAKTLHVNPTCTEQGKDTYTCLRCGDSYDESIPSLGHKSKPASCQYIAYCEVCGEVAHPQLDHNIVKCRCTICEGRTITGHEYENGICKGCGVAEPKEVKTNGITFLVPGETVFNILANGGAEVAVKSVQYNWCYGETYKLTITCEIEATSNVDSPYYIELACYKSDGKAFESAFVDIDTPVMESGQKVVVSGERYFTKGMTEVFEPNETYYVIIRDLIVFQFDKQDWIEG